MLALCLTLLVLIKGLYGQESIYYGPSSGECDSPVSFVRAHNSSMVKREADPTFRGHPKTREEKWAIAFHGTKNTFNQDPSLIKLLYMLARTHLNECTPIILYDSQVENSEGLFLQELMRDFPFPYVHGRITRENAITDSHILSAISKQCVNYVLFMADVMRAADVLGLQASSKIVVVARSSQWRVHEFLYHKASRSLVNLLVIAQSFRDDQSLETPYILYTHQLFVDGLGASKPVVLTSWMKGKLARPEIALFPQKMTKGYAGHRFSVVAADQPPFVFKKVYRDWLGNPKVSWEGIEYRLINLLGLRNNFSVEIKEPEELSVGSGDAVWKEIEMGRADIGMGGLYITSDRTANIDMSVGHTQDCAAFISLTSTALPRYRAIMGPFHWTVWLALTFTYLFGIFPLAFSDKHTLRHLIHNSGEVENMFWYVFGTFTNCFTFVGKNSWSRTTKVTTRLLIGWYWIFTIIITACYTGSIIAFVTLPVYPDTVDSVEELLYGHYRVGTLDRGGWERWFSNSSDEHTEKLFKHLELVPNMEAGLLNTTRAFFWPYAFLASKFQLEYIVQSNFSMESSKRSLLHISDRCFVPFGVGLAFPKSSVYTEKLNKGILMMMQSGIVSKLVADVKWKMQRSSSGKLLQVSSGSSLRTATADERGLSLSDTQGMFLLLGAGFLVAGGALLSEWLGGCGRMCKGRRGRRGRRSTSVSSATSATSTAISVSSASSTSRLAPSLESGKGHRKSDADGGGGLDGATVEGGGGVEKVPIDTDASIPPVDNSHSSHPSSAILVRSVEVCAEIVPEPVSNSANESNSNFNNDSNNKVQGHSRRSSNIDWDSEINTLFKLPGGGGRGSAGPDISEGSLGDIGEDATKVTDEVIKDATEEVVKYENDKGRIKADEELFGEKVSPV